MIPQPHEGSAEERLACLPLSLAESSDGEQSGRDMLRSFNHRCRNSLNGIKMSLYLFKRELGELSLPNLGELERAYHRLEVFFDWLQMIYRPLTVTLVRSPLGRLFDERIATWRSRFCTHGRTLELDPPLDDLAGEFDPMLLGLGLEAIIEWRAEACAANSKGILSWRIHGGLFEVRWQERRALNGSYNADRDHNVPQNMRPVPPVNSLAYLLLERIASAHGGMMETHYAPSFVMTLRWPQARGGAPAPCSGGTDHAWNC
jgi:hypothetical protein